MGRPTPRRHSGFTLIEVLVALGIMALMALLSWRGLDGMLRAQTQTRQHVDTVLTLQAGLGQWKSDLDALVTPDGSLSALDWDGRVLRLTRRSSAAPGDGLWVVAWSRGNDGQWQRWQSPALRNWGSWRQAWSQAQRWAQTPGAEDRQRTVALFPLEGWQLFYFRGNAWSNPLSSDGSAQTGETRTSDAPAQPLPVPEGIRLILTPAASTGWQGPVTLDWVRPTVGGGKS